MRGGTTVTRGGHRGGSPPHLGPIVALGLLVSIVAPAVAQQAGDKGAGGTSGAPAKAAAEPAATRQPRAPLGTTPSMYETGRVGRMAVQEAGIQVPQATGSPSREQNIQPQTSTSTTGATPPRPQSTGAIIDPAAFDRDLKGRFARLRSCKVEVARQRRTTPGALAGSRLLLRWTILPDGHVTDTRVVSVARVHGKVADCLKREMSQWAFDPPRGGPVTIERPFSF